MKKRLPMLSIGFFAGSVFGFLCAIAISNFWTQDISSSADRSLSPDGRYTAKVSSQFGTSTNHFDIRVFDSSSNLTRHLVVEDRLPGWSTDPTIGWSEDSESVLVGLIDPDAEMAIKEITIHVQKIF